MYKKSYWSLYRKLNIWFVYSIAIFFYLATELGATNYYISTVGDDNNSGISETSPWRTIQKGLDVAIQGDTIYVKAGNYGNENLVFLHDGTSTQTITLQGYHNSPGDSPVVNFSLNNPIDADTMPLISGSNRNLNTGITLNSRSYITVRNFQIKNYESGVYGYGISNIILDNIITVNTGDVTASYNGWGIVVVLAENCTIKNSIVLNSAAENIRVNGNNNILDNCKSYCNDNSAPYGSTDYYLCIQGNDNSITNCQVERVGDLSHPGHALILKGDCQHNEFKNCTAKGFVTGAFIVRHRGVKYNKFIDCIGYGCGILINDGANYNYFIRCKIYNAHAGITYWDSTEDDKYCAGYGNQITDCTFENITYCILYSYYGYADTYAYYNSYTGCSFNEAEAIFYTQRLNNREPLDDCIFKNIANYVKTGTYLLGVNTVIKNSEFRNIGFIFPAGNGNWGDPPTTPQGDITTGLVGYWKFDNSTINSGLDGGSGILKGNAAYSVNGKINQSIYLDGTGDYVDMGDVLDLVGESGITLAAWIRAEEWRSGAGIISKLVSGGNYRLLTTDISFQLGIRDSNNNYDAISILYDTFKTDKWYHIVATFDNSGTGQLYIDGSLSAERTGVNISRGDTASPLCIGYNANNNIYFKGWIDEVRIYNRVLTSEDVKTLYLDQ